MVFFLAFQQGGVDPDSTSEKKNTDLDPTVKKTTDQV